MKRNLRIGGAALVAFLACLSPARASPEGRAPANLDFENGTVGDAPTGWLVDPSGPGYSAVLTEEGVKSGKQCVVLTRSAGADSPVGNLMQSVDAAPYHGKIVRYRAAVRTSVSHPLRVQLWMRVDRPDGTGGFFDNMNDRPITADHWQSFEIVGEVADDAKDIKIGVFVMGEGQAWIDDVSLEIVGDFVQASEPPRPLVGRSLDNLVAFTKLLGYVRYFHPSDEAAATDWDQFSIAGVRRVEGASSPADLVRILKELFRPVAPAVRVFPTRERPEASARPAPPADASACKVITWRHFGVGTGSTRSIYTSEREDASEPWYVGDGAGGITFNLDAGPYRGKRIRLRAAVRAEVSGKNSQAQLEFIVSRPRYQTGFMDDMADRPITSDEWQEIVIIGRVDDDATLLNFGAHLVGEGRVWVDELTIELVGDADPPSAEMILRTDFERGDIDAALAGWVLDDESRREGYSISVTKDRPYSGRRCLLLDGTNLRKKQVPKPGEPFIADLGGGVSCAVPMALWATESGTLPAAKAEQDSSASADTQVPRPSGGDRATRLAAVALAWNVFQHFYPYFDVVHADWPAELRRALTAAANDSDERAFLDTLRRLVAALHDGHGRVFGMSGAWSRLPLVWDWIEGQLLVTYVGPASKLKIRPGDVILRVNGKPALEAVRHEEQFISSATPQWLRYRALAALAVGSEGELVTLDVRPYAGERFEVTLKRKKLRGEEVITEPRPEKIAELEPGIMYVDIGRVTNEDFSAALPELAQADGIVFDLRGYPRGGMMTIGHMIDKPVTCARWNIPLVSRPDREDFTYITKNWTIRPRTPRLTDNIVFITGGRAISAAETYLGIIEAYKIARIVGGPTAGTNGNVNTFKLPGGYRGSWTGMKVLKHDGSQHHGVGIQPTIPVSRTIAGVAAGRDELLEAALKAVRTAQRE